MIAVKPLTPVIGAGVARWRARITLSGGRPSRARARRIAVVAALLSAAGAAPAPAQAVSDVLESIRTGGGWISVPIRNGSGGIRTAAVPGLGLTVTGCIQVWDGHSGRWTIRARDLAGSGRLDAELRPGQPWRFTYTAGVTAQIDVETRWSERRDTTLHLWVGVQSLSDESGRDPCEPVYGERGASGRGTGASRSRLPADGRAVSHDASSSRAVPADGRGETDAVSDESTHGDTRRRPAPIVPSRPLDGRSGVSPPRDHRQRSIRPSRANAWSFSGDIRREVSIEWWASEESGGSTVIIAVNAPTEERSTPNGGFTEIHRRVALPPVAASATAPLSRPAERTSGEPRIDALGVAPRPGSRSWPLDGRPGVPPSRR